MAQVAVLICSEKPSVFNVPDTILRSIRRHRGASKGVHIPPGQLRSITHLEVTESRL